MQVVNDYESDLFASHSFVPTTVKLINALTFQPVCIFSKNLENQGFRPSQPGMNNPLVLNAPFLYPLKTTENIGFLMFSEGNDRVERMGENKLLTYFAQVQALSTIYPTSESSKHVLLKNCLNFGKPSKIINVSPIVENNGSIIKKRKQYRKEPYEPFQVVEKISMGKEVKIIVYGETRKIPYDDVQSLLRSKKYC